MAHNQWLTGYKILNFGAKNWRLLKDFSYFLCLVIVLILIIEYATITQLGADNSTKSGGTLILYYVN